MQDISKDIYEHVTAAVGALVRHRNLTSGEARGVVRVEVTMNGLTAIAAGSSVQDMIARGDDTNDLRRAYMRGRGAFKLAGVDCYVVESIENGDSWRIINALGTR